MTMTLGAVLFLAVVLCELLPVVRRNATWQNAGRLLFLRRDHLLHLGQRRGLASKWRACCATNFALHALIVLALVHFLHQLRHSATAGARIWHGGGRAAQCGRTQRPGVVRLEFYAGQLGGLRQT